MKWTSPVRRRRLDGVGEPMEVVLDDELLQTPPPRPRAPLQKKKSSEEKDDLTDEASSSAEDPAETRPKHRRTSSWTRVFGAPRRPKSPETLEAERVAKETKKAIKAGISGDRAHAFSHLKQKGGIKKYTKKVKE